MAQDLTPMPTALIFRPRAAALTPSLPPALRQVLEQGTTARILSAERGGGIELVEQPDWQPPAIEESLQNIATAAQEALLAHLDPIDEAKLGFTIGVFLAHRWLGRPEQPPSDLVAEALAGQWVDDLSEFPQWAVDKACRDYRRRVKFHPTIADIVERCEAAVAEDRRSLRLLERLLAAQRRQAA